MRATQTAQQGNDGPGNEAGENAGRKRGGGARNEHMYCVMCRESSGATRKWASIYSPCKSEA